jgi:hypothetical protein
MMKNVLIVFTVLAMASVANAAVQLSVNGVVDPPDSTIKLLPSEIAVIDVHSNTPAYAQITYLLMQGPGSISMGPDFWKWEQTVVSIPSLEKADLLPIFEVDMGYTNITEIIGIDITDASDPFTQPNGKVVDGLLFHCEGLGDVTLTLFDADLNVLDSQVIHQIPEPITFALLGLGGLFLRRRK